MALHTDSRNPIVVIVGTRPEGIKMIPVFFALRKAGLPTVLCSTMQHDELLTQVFDLFHVVPDFDLKIMRQGQDLFYITQSVLQKTKEIFQHIQPRMVLVQGDTTSTMAAALSAFYLNIPVGHVEAGLRTDDILSPFPEEMNRRVVGTIASLHFAPTAHAMGQLLGEGVDRSRVFCTGNTVVDALRMIRTSIQSGDIAVDETIVRHIEHCKKNNKKIMLLTAHRRESFQGGIVRVLLSVKQFLATHPDVFCFYPYHPNPCVVQAIHDVGLSSLDTICLCEPLAYKELAYVLLNVDWVLTDSGGIQEEAVSLGKPVLVLREKTERAEGVWAGLATIVGTESEKIAAHLYDLMQGKRTVVENDLQVYGDGYAAEKIVTIIAQECGSALQGVYMGKQEAQGMVTSSVQPPVDQARVEKQEILTKKVAVIGLGYIGLPTSLVMAQAGFNVVGIDIDQARVQAINAGDPVIQEPETFEKLQLVRGSGNFRASTTVEAADYFIIAVPTPFLENKKADLSYVFAAADSIAKVLQPGDTVILESTVPVGTTTALAQHLAQCTGLTPGSDFFVAHCPERVLPGKIFYELVHNARIVGGIDQPSMRAAQKLYEQFVEGSLYLTDATTAEMVKLVENSSRDVEIAFAHQVAAMATAVGLNPYEVIELANKHPRVNILQPSCGVGGHCIAVDPWFLVETFPQESVLLKTAREVNDARPHEVVKKIQLCVTDWQKKHTKKPVVLVLGLTYKANVDDLRESPSLAIAKILSTDPTCDVVISEPHINKKKLEHMFGDRLVSLQDGIMRADIIVYLVAHTRFRVLDEKLLKGKVVLDFCGIRHEPRACEGKTCLFWPAHKVACEECDTAVVIPEQHGDFFGEKCS
jgi:UDP-N-acetylglucosamine 2-epimerase (non-hydrolysing)